MDKNNQYRAAEVKLSYKTKTKQAIKVISSQDAYRLIIDSWDKDQIEYRESFKVILLNRANRVLGIVNIAEGGHSAVSVDIKIIMQAALLSNASGIIITHNHPSGNLNPSSSDNQITQKIKDCSLMMDIALLDHIIVTKNTYYSYADEGQL